MISKNCLSIIANNLWFQCNVCARYRLVVDMFFLDKIYIFINFVIHFSVMPWYTFYRNLKLAQSRGRDMFTFLLKSDIYNIKFLVRKYYENVLRVCLAKTQWILTHITMYLYVGCVSMWDIYIYIYIYIYICVCVYVYVDAYL